MCLLVAGKSCKGKWKTFRRPIKRKCWNLRICAVIMFVLLNFGGSLGSCSWGDGVKLCETWIRLWLIPTIYSYLIIVKNIVAESRVQIDKKYSIGINANTWLPFYVIRKSNPNVESVNILIHTWMDSIHKYHHFKHSLFSICE